VIWLAKYSPELSTKEREWRYLKRDVRGHLARSLRSFVDEIIAGLTRLGGARLDIVDRVPEWFFAGHRRPPTGRPRGRPRGVKDSVPRTKKCVNLPAPT
jgi:transposase